MQRQVASRPVVGGSVAVLLVAAVAHGCATVEQEPRSPSAPALPTVSAVASPTAQVQAPASGTARADGTAPSSSPHQALAGRWQAQPGMLVPRQGFDAARLADGSILVVGDDWDCHPGPAVAGSERAELFAPGAGAWVDVGPLNKPRKLFATVVLPDGSAMVLGGVNADDQPFSSTKVFSPATRRWSDGPLMNLAHERPHAVTMPDGRVVVVATDGDRSTVEILEPREGTWRFGAQPPDGADIHAITALVGGGVLAVGSDRTDTEAPPAAWLLEPARAGWRAIDPPVASFRVQVVALADGGALAVGGLGGGELAGRRWRGDQVFRLDSATWRWHEAASLSTPRLDAFVVGLGDGRVLAAGGRPRIDDLESSAAVASAEIYDPASDAWAPIADLLEPRADGEVLLLGDGSVLVLGGSADSNRGGDVPWCPTPLTTVERYWPD